MRIVALSDSPQNSGFGRISNEVFLRLAQRGHQIHVVSILWDGVMSDKDWYTPEKHNYPFQISGVAGRDIFSYAANIVNLARPDVVMSVQDFPYAVSLFYNCRLDWSRMAFAFITPIDGEPIAKDWLNLTDDADGRMVISEFGVQAMRRAGKRVGLCPPGIDHKYFKPASPEERKAFRAKAGISENAFILGMMAMNQGRKDIPHTLDGFAQFSMDKPEALLLMDMDKVSPAGWDIPYLMETKGIPKEKVLFKEELQRKGLVELRDRFCLLDAHSVLAHREGFGLPLIESQACMIPTISQDWCSGTEICNEGKGYLVKRKDQPRNSTWGGALDYDPDLNHFVEILEEIYRDPIQAKAVAKRGYDWARQRTWDKAADAVEEMLLEIEEKNARRIGDRTRVRGVTQGTQVVPDVSGQPTGTPAGSDTDGRREPGVRPAESSGDAVSGVSERTEPGVREERECRSQESDGQVSDVLQQRPGDAPDLAGSSSGTDGAEPQYWSSGNKVSLSKGC